MIPRNAPRIPTQQNLLIGCVQLAQELQKRTYQLDDLQNAVNRVTKELEASKKETGDLRKVCSDEVTSQ